MVQSRVTLGVSSNDIRGQKVSRCSASCADLLSEQAMHDKFVAVWWRGIVRTAVEICMLDPAQG